MWEPAGAGSEMLSLRTEMLQAPGTDILFACVQMFHVHMWRDSSSWKTVLPMEEIAYSVFFSANVKIFSVLL